MVNILVAPAAYKGSIAASRLGRAMAQAARQFFLERPASFLEPGAQFDLVVMEAPIADGGDDTVLCMHEALGGELVSRQVTGPTGQSLAASYLRFDDMAVVELAWPSGIAHLTSSTLDALNAQTFGLGQLIADAITSGAKKIVITLGGSASTDGGTGALTALGANFLNRDKEPIALGGGGLWELASVDLSQFMPRHADVEFIIATDVISPLLGPEGAACIFAPQKGADLKQVQYLEANLAHFAAKLADIIPQALGNVEAPGAGAAGGAGFGLATMLPAKIVSGFHFFAELIALEARIRQCDLLIVAEGCLDTQSLAGKGVGEIIAMARGYSKDILAVPAICTLDDTTIAQMGGQSKFIVAESARLSPALVAGLEEVERATKLGLARWLES